MDPIETINSEREALEIHSFFPFDKTEFPEEKGFTWIKTPVGEVPCGFTLMAERHTGLTTTGMAKLREAYTQPYTCKKYEFTPVKQAYNDVDHRTCTIATAANALRALTGTETTEEKLLSLIPEEEYDANGKLRTSVAIHLLESNRLDTEEIIPSRPEKIIGSLENGDVIFFNYRGHACLISGFITDGEGNFSLLLQDPDMNKPETYLINLAELSYLYSAPGLIENLTSIKRAVDAELEIPQNN